MMQHIFLIAVSIAWLVFGNATLSAQETGRSLMGMVAQWQYPDSTIEGAEMADGNTINSDGDRTLQSLSCQARMTTDDAVAKVIEYYQTKLQSPVQENGNNEKPKSKSGRSVIFHDDSAGRPFAMHVITVNTDGSSTTLVITRGKNETKTHIAWKQYLRF